MQRCAFAGREGQRNSSNGVNESAVLRGSHRRHVGEEQERWLRSSHACVPRILCTRHKCHGVINVTLGRKTHGKGQRQPVLSPICFTMTDPRDQERSEGQRPHCVIELPSPGDCPGPTFDQISFVRPPKPQLSSPETEKRPRQRR